jgi:hypothetical protein
LNDVMDIQRGVHYYLPITIISQINQCLSFSFLSFDGLLLICWSDRHFLPVKILSVAGDGWKRKCFFFFFSFWLTAAFTATAHTHR